MEALNKEFKFPFPPHKFQVEALHEIVDRDCSLLKFKVGLGKTFCSTLAALMYSIKDDVEQILILCTPILLDQWYEFLMTIEGIPDVLLYRGTPTERKLMDINEASVVLVSYNIWRGDRDHQRFVKMAKQNKMCLIADELSLKDLRSKVYKKLKMIMYRKLRLVFGEVAHHKLIALNATPISDLGQVYNWCSLFVPGVYISKRQFEAIHVEKQDPWGNVTRWKNEESLGTNMGLFSIDTTEEVKLPPLVETVVPFHLTAKHQKLYNDVKQAQLADLPADKIELAVNALFSTLQRLVLLPQDYGLDIRPPVMDFIEGYLDQIGDEGCLIYTRHKSVSKFYADSIPGCRAIYGDIGKAHREETFRMLKSGECTKLAGNMDSLGVGLNLQMLNHMVYLETPFRDDKLTQTLGRVHRQGQKETCFAVFPLAKGTIQYQIFYKLLKNQEDLSHVSKTKARVMDFLS